MTFIFWLMRFFPFWALPLVLIIGELGRYFRYRRNQAQWLCFGISALLLISSVLWFFYRGDLNSDHWVRMIFGKH